ncbi:MAG: tyrosine-type recombinase/integrase [Deltaproteobacteria bacterium]|nr:tyrosine-type recombinase/integrase [Deltaproteobacteria bacterium]
MAKWIKTNFPGVRFREHTTRKNGVKRDQYFTIRYKLAGKDREEGLGWASQNWTAAKAYERLTELKENRKAGEGPQTLAEKRTIEDTRKAAEKTEAARLEKESVTFGQYFENTYAPTSKVGRNKSTARKDDEHFRIWIKPVIGNIPLKDVKPFAIEKIKKNVLSAGKAPRTLQYIFATIRQAWNMARRDGLVMGDSPTKQVKVPKVDNKRVRFLSHEEAEALLKALQDKNALTHDLALLSLQTGLRMGEMAKLKWSHIDLDRGLITVMDPKGVEGRAAFMTVRVKAMLEAMKRGGPDDYIFTKMSGGQLQDAPREFSEVVADLGLNNGITDRRQRVFFHTCRHTFASWHVSAGTDLYTVKELMGHSVIAMTERYAHLSKGTLHNATMNLERAIDSAGQKKAEEDAGQVVNFTK